MVDNKQTSQANFGNPLKLKSLQFHFPQNPFVVREQFVIHMKCEKDEDFIVQRQFLHSQIFNDSKQKTIDIKVCENFLLFRSILNKSEKETFSSSLFTYDETLRAKYRGSSSSFAYMHVEMILTHSCSRSSSPSPFFLPRSLNIHPCLMRSVWYRFTHHPFTHTHIP